jgi:hypothetical protein
VLLLLLIPFDLIISLPGMLTKRMNYSVPSYLEKNSAGLLTLTTIHTKSFPVRCIRVKLRVTGDDFITKCHVLCTAEANGRNEVMIDTTRTGLTVFEVERVMVVSLLGLISLNKKTKRRLTVLVLPPPKRPVNAVTLPKGLILRPKPGGGYSEEHDMRKYRQGDPVRNIHWKLSAKFSSLIIREPLVPPNHSGLVHIMKWNNAGERDLILSHLRWVADYLFEQEMPFYVKLGKKTNTTEIKRENDLIEFLRDVLDDTEKKKLSFCAMPARFAWIYRVDAGTCTQAETQEQQEVVEK